MFWDNWIAACSQVLTSIDSGMGSLVLGSNYFDAISEWDRFKGGDLAVGPIAGLDEYNEDGLQPLHFAIKAGNLEAVSWLLKQEPPAPAHGKTIESQWNAAHFAVQMRQCSILETLNASNAALRQSNPEVPRILTDRDSQHRTPLMLALQQNAFDCVRELIRLETPLNPSNGDETLLHWAIHWSVEAPIFEILLRSMLPAIDVGSPVFLAASRANVPLFKLLVYFGADLMSFDARNQQNILHTAVASGSFAVLKLLVLGPLPIERVESVDGKVFAAWQLVQLLSALDSKQRTPLMMAVEAAHVEMVELLAAQFSRAHIDLVQPGSGNSALHLAVLGFHKTGALKVVRALLKGQPSVEICNATGKTALILAKGSEMDEVVEELEDFETWAHL
jgi:ankyrin repeat protein